MEKHDIEKHDVPLPGTLLFVMVMGAAFVFGWLVLFLVMKGRY